MPPRQNLLSIGRPSVRRAALLTADATTWRVQAIHEVLLKERIIGKVEINVVDGAVIEEHAILTLVEHVAIAMNFHA